MKALIAFAAAVPLFTGAAFAQEDNRPAVEGIADVRSEADNYDPYHGISTSADINGAVIGENGERYDLAWAGGADACSDVLREQWDYVSYDRSLNMHYLNTVDAATFAQKRQVVEAAFRSVTQGGIFQGFGSYDSFSRAFSTLKTHLEWDYNETQSLQIIRSYLSEPQVNAWAACMEAQQHGTHVYFQDVTEDIAYVRVNWSTPGDPRQIDWRASSLLINGAEPGWEVRIFPANKLASTFTDTFMLTRTKDADGQPVHLDVSADIAGSRNSAYLIQPDPIPPAPERTCQRFGPDTHQCRGVDLVTAAVGQRDCEALITQLGLECGIYQPVGPGYCAVRSSNLEADCDGCTADVTFALQCLPIETDD